jgi:hypothetical protein
MMRGLLLVMLLGAGALAVPSARACPMCQEAAGSPRAGQDDAAKQARAFNNAIYLMVSMPYLLLGGLGFLFYRSVQKARREGISDQPADNSELGG